MTTNLVETLEAYERLEREYGTLHTEFVEMLQRYIKLADFVAIDTVLDMFPKKHQDLVCEIYKDIEKARAYLEELEK